MYNFQTSTPVVYDSTPDKNWWALQKCSSRNEASMEKLPEEIRSLVLQGQLYFHPLTQSFFSFTSLWGWLQYEGYLGPDKTFIPNKGCTSQDNRERQEFFHKCNVRVPGFVQPSIASKSTSKALKRKRRV